MISHADVEKLLGIQAAERSVLSVYLQVPVNPPALRGLPARVDELLALAGGADGLGALRARDEGRRMVRRLLEVHARDWLGHTVAIFACSQLGLSEAVLLTCRLPERAVLATRPHVRPLLAALQRCPAYRVAVVDRRHAWIFSVAGDRVSVVAQPVAGRGGSPAFGGWCGPEDPRAHQRGAGTAWTPTGSTTASPSLPAITTRTRLPFSGRPCIPVSGSRSLSAGTRRLSLSSSRSSRPTWLSASPGALPSIRTP